MVLLKKKMHGIPDGVDAHAPRLLPTFRPATATWPGTSAWPCLCQPCCKQERTQLRCMPKRLTLEIRGSRRMILCTHSILDSRLDILPANSRTNQSLRVPKGDET